MAKKRRKKVAKKTEPDPFAMTQDGLDDMGEPEPVKQIRLENKIPKRNTFLSDTYRDERDALILNAEIGKREHKGKIETITTIKHMVVDADGFWVTEFIIDLKG